MTKPKSKSKSKPPRPNKNSDGQDKKQSQNPDGGGGGAPQQAGPPSLVPPGGPKSMADIHAQSQAQAGQPPQPQPGPDGTVAPSQWPHDMVRESINFKDLPPMAQAQMQQQEGIDPAAPLKMIQGQLQSSMQEQAQQQPGAAVPASFIGPMTPPGLENFPHDMAALTQVMQRGYAPGADNAEHAMAQNAHSMARAAEAHAQNQAAQSGQQEQVMQALGALLQQASMQGGVPAPEEMAKRHARAQIPGLKHPTGQPQLQSSM